MAFSLREKAGALWLEVLSFRRKQQIFRQTDPAAVRHLMPAVDVKPSWFGSGYGGFYIIPRLMEKGSVVYSFGTGRDITFDLACIRKLGATVYAFDPTPKSIDWVMKQMLPAEFRFNPYGISAGNSGPAVFYMPANPRAVSGSTVRHGEVNEGNSVTVMLKSFSDIIAEHGHSHINVLKMDIEGSEYEVLETIMNSPVKIDQLLIEFHDRNFSNVPAKSVATVKMLAEKGFLPFGCSKSYEEVSFVRSELVR